jgi:hypothetical protein
VLGPTGPTVPIHGPFGLGRVVGPDHAGPAVAAPAQGEGTNVSAKAHAHDLPH